MGFILYILAFIMFIPLTIINIIIVLWKNPNLKTLNNYFFEGAIDIDRFGNRNFRSLFNLVLRKKNGHSFGNEKETISSVLGKNKASNRLSILGVLVCKILNFLDKNHVEKSIRYNL